MIKLLADENLDNTIIRGLLRRNPDIDIVRVQDIDLSGEDDPVVLEWAASQGRVLLTHDVATITRYAYERLANTLAMPGVIEIHTDASIGRVIEDLFMILECGTPEDLDGQIYYLPL
jgi:predicted nuclease of predicted toxin-antitoxin system